MDRPEITQDAQRLAVLIYKQYKKDIKDGQSKQQAKNIGSLKNVHKILNIKYSLEDTLELIKELKAENYINAVWGSDTATSIDIQQKLIVFGENKLANDIDGALNWANKIVSIIKP
ncbi:hypothetical protein AB0Y21_10375 [Weissella paramesenteroides]|uniref:hypothetical protein n=1 Tax=Weissella paramesenteroides TaxID=1249 RepID=UPI003F299ADF